VIDALGHGERANEAAVRALELLELCYREPLTDIVATCHAGLVHTRGAAMGLCSVRAKDRVIEHLAIGNVEMRLFSPEPVHTISFNGTVGMQMEKHQVMTYPFRPGSRLLMFTDGISGKLEVPPELLGRAPIETATYVFNNYRREYDDATIVALA